MKFITIDNVLLEQAGNKIYYSFEDEFVGRKLKDNYEKNYDKLEREYFESDSFLERAISFSYELKKDDDEYIKSIDVHKFRDKYFGHGRPVVDELDISKKDESFIRRCINDSVATTLDDEYDGLVERIKETKKLPYGYKLEKCSAKGIILNDKKNKTVTVPKESIKKSLALSHKYLDILFDDVLFKENEDLFNKDEIRPLLSITSCCDYSNYHNLHELQEGVERRKIIRESEKGYKELVKAVKNDDAEKINEYAKYSVAYENDYESNKNHPLILALTKHPEFVEVLIRAGSYANPKCHLKKYNPIHTSAIEIAYKNRDYKSLELLANCYDPSKIEKNVNQVKWGETNTYKSAVSYFSQEVCSLMQKDFDYDSLRILLPHTAGIVLTMPKFSSELDEKQIDFLCGYDNIRIDWEEKDFKKVYSIDPKLCKRMVEQGCNKLAINYFIDIDDFDLFKTAMEKWVNTQDLFFKKESYNQIFTKDPKWHEIAKNTTWRYRELDNNYLSDLFENDRDKFEETLYAYNLNASDAYAVKRFLNTLLKEKDIISFVDFVKKHNISLRSDTLQDLNQYLDVYNAQERKDIFDFIFEHYGSVNYLSAGSYNSNLNEKSINDHFLRAAYKYGSDVLINKCIDKFLINSTKKTNDFTNHFKENYYQAMSDCNEWACSELIRKTLDHFKKGEKDSSLFEGPYSDRLYLPIGEMFRTLRNLHYAHFGWPPNEEKTEIRHQIIKKDMTYYLKNIDIGILFMDGALYEWSRDSSTMLSDIERAMVDDQNVIATVKEYVPLRSRTNTD